LSEEKPNLADFDKIGESINKVADPALNPQSTTPPASPDPAQPQANSANSAAQSQQSPQATPPQNPNQPQQAKPAGNKKPPQKINPAKVAMGCGTFFIVLFIILIVAMVFGLRAGEETISGFGLNPASFKNWTIGMVSFFFGFLGLVGVIVSLYQLGRTLLAKKEETYIKKSSRNKSIFAFIFFVLIMVIWGTVYSYINRFEMEQQQLPVEIVTEPENTLSLTSPIQVDFSAERITDGYKAAYDIVSYEWDKDADGVADDTGEKVTLYFPHGGKNNGVYDVTLLVRLQPRGGGDMEVKTFEKQVSISKQEIYGEIEVDKASGEIPLTVKFEADQVADPDGSQIINYAWDLDGDGRPDRDGPNYRQTEYTFESIGEHTVYLTVTSDDYVESGQHEEKTFEKTITVFEPQDLVDAEVVIEATPEKGVAPLLVNFDASKTESNDYKIEKYEWLIGDGLANLRGVRNKFTFEKPGTYPVTLKATYNTGQSKTAMIEINVSSTNIAPVAKITTTPAYSAKYGAVAGPSPLTVSFDASESEDEDDNIVKYDWDFDGDGIWDEEGSKLTHTYKDIGNFEAKLRVSDADENQSIATIAIRVDEEIPIIDFGADKLSGAAPLTINFDASGSKLPKDRKIISYEWNFGDSGSTQNFIYERAQTSHQFQNVGEYEVKLILHADDGETYEDILNVIATQAVLSARFTPSRSSGEAPLAVSFDASASSGSIAKGLWDFGDGSAQGSGKEVTHVFEKAGSYEVTLTIYDALGNVSSYSKTIEAE
jgi:PKD repeat protein/uncharacterized membrane protein